MVNAKMLLDVLILSIIDESQPFVFEVRDVAVILIDGDVVDMAEFATSQIRAGISTRSRLLPNIVENLSISDLVLMLRASHVIKIGRSSARMPVWL